jgi:hypothetical protein
VPAPLKVLEQALLDLRGDVRVGLDDPVVQVMTESAGLRDLRCAARDQPGLVAVPQPVERQPRPDRRTARLRLGRLAAVDGGAEDAAKEGRARQRYQERRQRDRPRRSPGLRRTQPPHRPRLVQRTNQRIDHDHATPQIDVVPIQAGQLAPSAADPRRGADFEPTPRSCEDYDPLKGKQPA